MASPVEDPSSIRDKKLVDQVGNEIGQICEIYEQDGELRVPYSSQHLNDSPEVESEDELSEEDEHALRAYYSVSIGDGELRTDNDSYAAQVPDSDAPSKKAGGSSDGGGDAREGSEDARGREGADGGGGGSAGHEGS